MDHGLRLKYYKDSFAKFQNKGVFFIWACRIRLERLRFNQAGEIGRRRGEWRRRHGRTKGAHRRRWFRAYGAWFDERETRGEREEGGELTETEKNEREAMTAARRSTKRRRLSKLAATLGLTDSARTGATLALGFG